MTGFRPAILLVNNSGYAVVEYPVAE